jgi:peptidyl-prolyl cis-trans isomerase B (cyclophilin B)
MNARRSFRSPIALRELTAFAALMTVALVAVAIVTTAGCGDKVATTPDPTTAQDFAWPASPQLTATFHVRDRGTIEVALYPDVAPETVANFVKLANEGFYDGTTFHRVIPGFMIQGGDPNTRDKSPSDDGSGGPGYMIDDEFNAAPHARGTLSMANMSRANTGGSQFFIIHQDAPHLQGKHAAFGRVVRGMEIVDGITEADVDQHGRWGPKARPIESVVVEKIEIREGPSAG